MLLAHRLSSAIGWHEKKSAAYRLLGQHSFTAGVVWGIGENFTKTVFSAVELVEMLALAEYWESKHNNTLMGQVRANMFMTAMPGVSLSMAVTSHFWPGFDQKAKEAYEERGALIDAIKYAFAHPKDLLGSLTKAQEARFKEFMASLGEKSLAGNFHAGKLMGELLFDLFMVIDLVAGLAKLVAALPKLARYAEDFAKLAREFRAAKQLETKVSELAEPGPRMTQAEKDTAQARMRGGSDRTRPPPSDPPPRAEEPDKPPPPDRTGPLYDDPSQAVKDRVAQLKDAIPENSKGRITMAAAVVEDDTGARSMLISTSEPRGYLRPGVELNDDEILVPGTGHAEADIVSYASENGLKVVDIGATRPVCSACADAIAPTGANISTPLKGGP
jgi:hypothetical protein